MPETRREINARTEKEVDVLVAHLVLLASLFTVPNYTTNSASLLTLDASLPASNDLSVQVLDHKELVCSRTLLLLPYTLFCVKLFLVYQLIPISLLTHNNTSHLEKSLPWSHITL